MLKQPLHFYPDPSEAPEILHKLNEIVLGADAYLILTAVYNRCLPPALTNLMNHLPPPRYEISEFCRTFLNVIYLFSMVVIFLTLFANLKIYLMSRMLESISERHIYRSLSFTVFLSFPFIVSSLKRLVSCRIR